MPATAIIIAAIVGANLGLAEPAVEQWENCNAGAVETRLEACTFIAGNVEFGRKPRAYAAATLGDLRLEQSRLDEAIAEFSRSIRLDPDYSYPFRRRAFANFLQDRNDEALADYDMAIELAPLDPYAFLSRSSFYRQSGEPELARQDIEKALRLDLDNSDLYYERGLLSLDVKDYEQAELDFRKALRLRPEEQDARYNLANALRFQSRTEEALSEIGTYIENRAEDSQGYRMRGWLRVDAGDYDEAYADFEAAAKMRPDDLTLQYALGYVHWRRREFHDALARYSAVEPEYEKTSYYFYERGYARYMINQDRLALDDADRALEIDPGDVDAFWLKGAALLYLDEYQQAVAALDEAARLAPDSVDVLIMRARVQIAWGHNIAAIGDLSKALELRPDNVQARTYRGYASGLAGYVDQAMRILNEVIEQHPDMSLAYELSARLLYKDKDYPAARSYSERLLELVPDDAAYRVLHADIMLELEQYREAYSVYRAAIDSVPEPSASWLRLGAFSAFKSDDTDEALELLVRAKSADPDDVWTNAMLADLWLEKSEFEKAAKAFEQAMTGTDDDDNLFSYRFGKAKADAGAGRREAALKMLTVLAKQQPGNMDVSWARANVLLELGELEDALVEFEHFRRRRPASLEAHYTLIDIMIETGRHAAALKLADRVIYMEYDKAAGYRARGRIYLAMKDFEAAGRDVDEAIGLDPDDAGLQSIRAQVYLGQGAALPALQSASRAVELAPRSLSHRVLLARVYLARNDAGAALSALDEALALSVGEVQIAVEAHRLKAQAHKVLGQIADARAALEIAEELENGQPASQTAGLHGDLRR